MPSGTMNHPQPATLYPLGGSLFASVKTWRGAVKIHVRHYASPTNTKGGRVVPTQRGVTMDLKEFRRLLKVQKRLSEDYSQQLSSLSPEEEKPRASVGPQSREHQLPLADYHPPTADPMSSSAQSGSYLQQLQRPLSSTCPTYCPSSASSQPPPLYSNDGYETDSES